MTRNRVRALPRRMPQSDEPPRVAEMWMHLVIGAEVERPSCEEKLCVFAVEVQERP